jgi:hypothetical protein
MTAASRVPAPPVGHSVAPRPVRPMLSSCAVQHWRICIEPTANSAAAAASFTFKCVASGRNSLPLAGNGACSRGASWVNKLDREELRS